MLGAPSAFQKLPPFPCCNISLNPDPMEFCLSGDLFRKNEDVLRAGKSGVEVIPNVSKTTNPQPLSPVTVLPLVPQTGNQRSRSGERLLTLLGCCQS